MAAHGTSRSGPVRLTKASCGEALPGEAPFGVAGLCGPRCGAAWRGLSCCSLVLQGPVRFAAARLGILRPGVAIQACVARGAVACATVRLGLSRRGTVGIGEGWPGDPRLGRAGFGVSWLRMATSGPARSSWVGCGLSRLGQSRRGPARLVEARLFSVCLREVCLGQVMQRMARSFVLRLRKVMWALVRFGRVWRFRVRSAAGLAWHVDVRCGPPGFGAVRHGDAFHGLLGLRVARYSNVRPGDVRHGEVCLRLSRRAVPWRVRARLPEVW